jgi:hypothetical protein
MSSPQSMSKPSFKQNSNVLLHGISLSVNSSKTGQGCRPVTCGSKKPAESCDWHSEGPVKCFPLLKLVPTLYPHRPQHRLKTTSGFHSHPLLLATPAPACRITQRDTRRPDGGVLLVDVRLASPLQRLVGSWLGTQHVAEESAL